MHAGQGRRRSNLAGVKLLGRKKDGDATADVDSAVAEETVEKASGATAPKGRPTPKRSQAAPRRGPVAPAPMTASEARRRRKAVGGPKLSRAERTAERIERRERMSERREKMLAGEDAYLLPRDKGPVRRFVRDLVDSRRNVLGLFMPVALGLLSVMLVMPQLQMFVSPGILVVVAVMVIDGILLARRVNMRVDEKYPDNSETGWKLGFYAASRASQLRRMRAPKPQVNRGDNVV